MKNKIKDIEETAIAEASISRLERRKYLKRFQKEQPFKKEEKSSDRLFQITKINEVEGTSTGDRYLIKKSLSSGTLKLGAKIIGVVNDKQVVVYPPPQGLEFAPLPEPAILEEEAAGLSLAIEIRFA